MNSTEGPTVTDESINTNPQSVGEHEDPPVVLSVGVLLQDWDEESLDCKSLGQGRP